MKFPSIRDVAHDLRVENRTLDPADFPTDNGHGEAEFCDVRLQVLPDGRWAIRVGDSSYDLDHNGYWGNGSINGRRFNSYELARDLIDQCKDHHAQTEESYPMKPINARKLKQTVTEKTPGLKITLHAEREDDDPRGHFASGDDAADKALSDSIIARSNNGDVWAWCFVRVTATYRGVSVSNTLGACSYESEKEFREGGYYADMVYEVLKQLNAQLEAIDACDLAPHNRAILACACGYKRTNGNGR